MPISIKNKTTRFVSHNRNLPEPIPAMGNEAYQEERKFALEYSESRNKNYEIYLNSKRENTELNYLPIKLDIENFSRCNFRCTMCQVSDWTKGKRAKDLPFEDFKNLIDQQYGLVEIKLQGMGEPTLQGEDYFKMIQYARAKKIWVRTITNASILHHSEYYRKLIDADPNEVQISIDGATKEVFEGIRQKSRFEKVVSNCKLINNYCEEKGIQRTKMWTVVQKENIHQMKDLVYLANEMRFKNMVFSLNLTDWGQIEWTERNNGKLIEDNLDIEACLKLVEIGKEMGIYVSFWRVVDKYKSDNLDTLCPWPFERAYVSSDQRVVPCCLLGNPDVLDLGGSNNFSATWNSTKYKNFRKDHLSGKIPYVCKGCYQIEER